MIDHEASIISEEIRSEGVVANASPKARFGRRCTHAEEMVPALADAFSAFTDSAMKLSLTYKNLEKQLERVSQELELKNRQLNESLQEKERLYYYLRSILESMNSGIIAVDLDGSITMFNKAAKDFFPIHASDAIGKKYQEVTRSEDSILLDTLKTLLPYSKEEVIVSPQKGALNVKSSTTLVRDENNQVLGALEVIVDLTEWRKLEEQVQRVKTLAAMGEMSVSIAHDLRNPLAAIQLLAETLQNGSPHEIEEASLPREITPVDRLSRLDSIISRGESRDTKELISRGELSITERRRLAADILEGVYSMNKTVSNLLSLTRPATLNLQVVNMARLLDDALLLCDYALRQNKIQVIRDYPKWGLNCEVDYEQFKQVALNLILNAVEAMPNGGSLKIRAKNLEYNSQACDACEFTDDRSGLSETPSTLELRFEDSGIGIPEELHKKIFHPFFTTKERGMGLGLSIVHKVLMSHKASVDVESNPPPTPPRGGKEKIGTNFIIHLPVQQDSNDFEVSRRMIPLT